MTWQRVSLGLLVKVSLRCQQDWPHCCFQCFGSISSHHAASVLRAVLLLLLRCNRW